MSDTRNLPVGIHDGVPMAEYLAMRCLSASTCHHILTYSPHHARYWQTSDERDDTEASDTGTAIHDALLEGVDRIAPIDAGDWRTKAAKEARDATRAEGRIPLLAHKALRVIEAVKAAKEFIAGSEIAGAFDTGAPEQTVIWEEDGLRCKARPDWLTERWHVSVKTTKGSANPEAFIRGPLVQMGYDVAALFYERGLAFAANAAPVTVFLVIEQEPPHGCSLIALDPAMADIANQKVERAMAIWRKCKASGIYPSYAPRIHYAEPRPWQIAEAEQSALDAAYDELQMKEGIEP